MGQLGFQHANRRRLGRDGKGKSVYDIKTAGEHRSDWKVAIDDYHRYQEDFDYMQQLGMNCYRFQISWSRVQPDGQGAFNEAGIAYYDKFIDELLKRGIQPMVCLYHFDMPLALAKKYDGFVSREVTDAFVKYGIEMVKRFGDKVKYWLTFNEQNLYNTPGASTFAGNLKTPETESLIYTIGHHVMLAHAQIANYIHEHTNDQIGGMLAYQEVYPASCKPEDILAARKIDEFYNNNLLDVFTRGEYSPEVMTFLKDHKIDFDFRDGDAELLAPTRSDFLPFSYYRTTTVNASKIPAGTTPTYFLEKGGQDNPNLKTTAEWNWQIDPLGFRDIIDKMYARYRVPIFPIENGIGVIEHWDGEHEIQDDYRIQYHQQHLQAMRDAMFEDGVPVVGYLGWGLIDILSSQGDMRKRYGVVYVNRTNHDLRDLKRMPKKSFHWLQRVIKTNGAALDEEAK
ncbi:glycoside hydrolase family 1 protein [Lacticaseibacillus camelliae]|uniref:glycoside hydrolase family 1 protein n=1 Tax=Lacticaseibacillus camelliae TaxID=381742 RepID=UPI000AEC0EC7